MPFHDSPFSGPLNTSTIVIFTRILAYYAGTAAWRSTQRPRRNCAVTIRHRASLSAACTVNIADKRLGTARAYLATLTPMEPAILYVDDERANLDLFRRTFDEEFRVLTAETGH